MATGSLIPMHSHENKAVIDLFSENEDQQVLYRGKLIDAAISAKEKNLLTRENDGLYVDGHILGEFTYMNGILKFKGVTVSQEYDKRSVDVMIYDLWKEIDEILAAEKEPEEEPESEEEEGEGNDAGESETGDAEEQSDTP